MSILAQKNETIQQVSDYLNSGKCNQLITKPEDYSNLLIDLDDDILWYHEWHRCAKDFLWFSRHWLWIENKQAQMQLLEPNPAQLKFIKNWTDLDIIDKARKEGFSTIISGRFYHRNSFKPLTKTVVIAHDAESSELLFETPKRFYDNLPDGLKPVKEYDSKKQLTFKTSPIWNLNGKPYCIKLDTKYSVLTAGSKEIGRSRDVDQVHLSEFAFYPNPEKIATGILNALRENATVVIESTANGFNSFYEYWTGACNDTTGYKPHFFAWFDDPTNTREIPDGAKFEPEESERNMQAQYNLTDEQLYWYYRKRRSTPEMWSLIKQEYPCTAEESFQQSNDCIFNTDKLNTLLHEAENIKPIHTRLFGKLRIYRRPEAGHKYIAGVDTATGEADDRSCVIILDREDWSTVAVYDARHVELHDFKKQAVRIAKIYNALYTPEANSYGFTVLDYAIKEAMYPNIYKYKDFDKTAKKNVWKKGFYTTAKSRPLLISDLQEAIEEGLLNICDPVIVKELMAFVKHDNGKPTIRAQTGQNDDMVIALGIAVYVAKRTSTGFNMRTL
jgi:hypothetical protein